MTALDTVCAEALSSLEAAHLKRTLKPTQRENAVRITRHGKTLTSFSCNNYLGLTHHPEVMQAMIEAVERYGTGSGASRLVTGNSQLYRTLEQSLAELKGTDASVVFGSGYLANTGTIQALASSKDLVLIDRLAHASLIDGTQHSGARFQRFKHNDVPDCERLLKKLRHKHQHCLIVTDAVFSMDGDLAPLDALRKLCQRYDAWLVADDAHGLGAISTNAHTKCADIQLGTLSKAVGSYGGYACASHSVVEFLQNTARPLIYSTALPPAVLAASIKALEIIQSQANLTQEPVKKAAYFCSLLELPEPQTPIVPIVIGDAADTMRASLMLEELGFMVAAIRPPTVPDGTSRLRFSFCAEHEDADIEKVAAILIEQGWRDTHRRFLEAA